jgi:predicted DNA binding protein
MPRARLKFHAGATEDWMAAISIEFPDSEFEILSGRLVDDGLLGIAEIRTSNGEAIVRRFEDALEVRSSEVVHTDKQSVLIQYVIPVPGSYGALRASGNLPRFPATMRDGWLHTELTASQERLARFRNELEAIGISCQVLSVTQSHDSVDLLTDRQRQFVTEAVTRGYYDTPRGCTLSELAETFEVNRSAASGVLRRAEGRIIGEFVSQNFT